MRIALKESSTMAVTYLELSQAYQTQVLELIEQSQKIAVQNASAWAKAARPFAKDLPGAREGLDVPAPKELVDNAFGFAAKLVSAQHAYWTAVASAVEPGLPKAKAPAAK
jgi:hypothetical protein